MVLLHTPAFEEGVFAPDFTLKDTNGNLTSLQNCQGGKGLVVAFICNHCPYVLAIIDRLTRDFKMLQEEGIGCVAIMPNDTENYPADSYDNMITFAEQYNFTFPYLIDETQETAKAYGAICTPDFFGFNADGLLQYRGRLDSAANKEETPQTTHELVDAMRRIADIGADPHQQFPSMGCSIKWR